jgi:protein tyrosine/serine phosphatase
VNVRDLGGLPRAGGGTTAFGSVVRSDNIRHLTARGWSSLCAYGVQRIVDLRFVRERSGEPSVPDGVEVVAVSLFGDHDPSDEARVDAAIAAAEDEPSAIAAFYLDTLETRSGQVAAAVEAIAAAPDGAVVVHCFVGKDRTGIVSALLLQLAGVDDEVITADYAMSAPAVGPLVDDWIAAAGSEHEREFRRRVSSAPAEGLRRVLRQLRSDFGGAERYLADAGLEPTAIDGARRRLAGRRSSAYRPPRYIV